MGIEDKNSVDANLTMTRLGNSHGHDPSFHELFGIARVGPVGELLGSQQSQGVTDAVDMAVFLLWNLMLDYRIPADLSQVQGVRGAGREMPARFIFSGKARQPL